VEVAEPITTADAPVVLQLKQAPVMAFQPSGVEVQLAEVVTPPPPQTLTPAPAQDADRAADLPHTASSLPLIALLGLLALFGSVVFRIAERRVQ
jgi:hypothetical protein